MDITLHHDIALLSPIIILSIGSLVILLFEVFQGEDWPRGGMTGLFLVAALGASQLTWAYGVSDQTVFSGLMYADPFSLFVTFLLIFGASLALLMSIGRLKEEGIEAEGEYYSLFLMSTVGAIIFASAAELITLFVGLEIMSMGLYCLCGSALGSKHSSESALKYFFLGSFASAFLLYGVALLYGLSGSTTIPEIATYVANSSLRVEHTLLFIALGLMLVGFIFKVGAVPFHFWIPDVYQGAPPPYSDKGAKNATNIYPACPILE